MDKRIKMGALLIALTLTFSPLMTFANVWQDEINSNNEDKKELQKQKEYTQILKAGANKELQAIKEKAEAKGAEVTESNVKVQSFQIKIDELQGHIDALQFNIDKAQSDIESKQVLLKEKEQESLERQKMLDDRLRSFYKSDMNSQALSIIFNSESISDLIRNLVSVSKLMKLDKKLLNEIEEAKVNLETERISLQKEMDKLNEEKEQIKNKKQEQINAQKQFINEKNNYQAQMQTLKSLENEKEKIVKSLSKEEKELEDRIGDIDSYNEDLKEKIDRMFEDINNNSNTDPNISNGEGFLKPAVGGISSYYGPRVHPITGVNGFHTGIDIAAADKSNIMASKSGTVVFAGIQSGYGNVVILDHGKGIQTLYAHCSSMLVSYGQKVGRGQTIAKIGSTGNSTGPHLHFEVRVNGKHTDPMKYL